MALSRTSLTPAPSGPGGATRRALRPDRLLGYREDTSWYRRKELGEVMSEFDWLDSHVRASPAQQAQTARAWREQEIVAGAMLLARLGYSRDYATARMRGNVDWEYDRLGAASISKRISTLVGEAYDRLGVGGKKKKIRKSDKSQDKALATKA